MKHDIDCRAVRRLDELNRPCGNARRCCRAPQDICNGIIGRNCF